MRTITQEQKLDHYDKLQAHADKVAWALQDTANGRFCSPVTIKLKSEKVKILVSRSDRGMPIYLVRQRIPGQLDLVDVWTEAEVEDMYRLRPTMDYCQALYSAKLQLDMAGKVSACVPGAGNLDNPCDSGPRTYCLGHDWF